MFQYFNWLSCISSSSDAAKSPLTQSSMLLLMLLLQLRGPLVLMHILRSLHWLKVQERIDYKVISTTYKLIQSSSPCYTCTISSTPRYSIIYIYIIVTMFTLSQTALFDMPHLTCGTKSSSIFVFLITPVHHRYPSHLHHRPWSRTDHALVDLSHNAFHSRLKTTRFLKSFSPGLISRNFTTRCFGSHLWHNIGKYNRPTAD